MGQLDKELGITAIRTSPYHPETEGLVESFNQALKTMLRKFVSDTGKDWDKWLPFLLFAYREMPQASTGCCTICPPDERPVGAVQRGGQTQPPGGPEAPKTVV